MIAFLVSKVNNNRALVIFTSRCEKVFKRCLYQNFNFCVGNKTKGMTTLLGLVRLGDCAAQWRVGVRRTEFTLPKHRL